MKKKLFGIIPLALTLVACGSGGEGDKADTDEAKEAAIENVAKEGFPIVDETEEMTFFANKGAVNEPHDWNDLFIWNEYEDMTNVDIEWDQVPTDALEERRNLSLVQSDLPDVYYYAGFPSADIYKYGQQEVFVELNDLIDDYAPNLSKALDENPDVRKAITFPDGNIYSLPIIIDSDFTSFQIASRPWTNVDWLDELEMEMPETTDEFYDYLVALKELDPAGDGQTIPFGSTSIDELIHYIAGSFGVQNRGVSNGPVDYDEENEELRFYPATEGYKDALKYMNKLYEEELIDPGIFTIEWGDFLAKAQENRYGTMIFYEPVELFGDEIGEQYDYMTALKGPEGHQIFSKALPRVRSIGNYIITESNPNPAAAVRWLDYFYSDEGAEFFYMGVEGETFEMVDGEAQYIDEIKNPSEGSTFEQEVSKYLGWVGAEQGFIKQEYFQGSETGEYSLRATEDIKPQMPEIWNSFTYTEEENEFMNSSGEDIVKYVNEMRDKFIAGDSSIDDEWDEFIETLENMGLDEFVDIKKAAFERYQAAD